LVRKDDEAVVDDDNDEDIDGRLEYAVDDRLEDAIEDRLEAAFKTSFRPLILRVALGVAKMEEGEGEGLSEYLVAITAADAALEDEKVAAEAADFEVADAEVVRIGVERMATFISAPPPTPSRRFWSTPKFSVFELSLSRPTILLPEQEDSEEGKEEDAEEKGEVKVTLDVEEELFLIS
jgi:hypothetical protein